MIQIVLKEMSSGIIREGTNHGLAGTEVTSVPVAKVILIGKH